MFDLPDVTHKALVFTLTKPLRQGQQMYHHLVVYVPTEKTVISLNLDEAILQEKYAGRLQSTMRDEAYKLVAKLFKFLGGIKLYSSGEFRTSRGTPYVKCVYKSDGGLLYFMEKTIFFIHKPTLQIHYDVPIEIRSHIGHSEREVQSLRPQRQEWKSKLRSLRSLRGGWRRRFKPRDRMARDSHSTISNSGGRGDV